MTDIDIRCTLIGADGRKLSSGKALLHGPVLPGKTRNVHISVKAGAEKAETAECVDRKLRNEWVIWSYAAEVNAVTAQKGKWTKWEEVFNGSSACRQGRVVASHKRLDEIRRDHPKAKIKSSTIIYSAEGKRFTERLQCVQIDVDMNR